MTRRRLWRGLVLVVAVLTLLLLVAVVGIRVYGSIRLHEAERLFTKEVGPIACAAYAPPPVPPGLNGANLLTGGAQAIVLSEREVLGTMAEPPDLSRSEEDRERVRGVLASNASALAVLRQARSYSAFNLNIPYAAGLHAWIPNLVEANNATKLLANDAALAVHDGDLERAIQDVETLGVQARTYTAEAILVVHMIGMAIERNQLWMAALVVSSPQAEVTAVERVRASLQTSDLPAAYRRALAFDGAAVRRAFQDPSTIWPARDLPVSRALSIPEKVFFDLTGPLVAADALDRTRLLTSALTGTRAETERGMARLQGKGSWVFGKWFVAIPNLVAVAQRALETASLRRVAAAAIDCRLESLRTGRYPEMLPQAHRAPEPLLGLPLRYERQRDGSLVIEVPGAADVVKHASGFRWTLPPVSPPSPR